MKSNKIKENGVSDTENVRSSNCKVSLIVCKSWAF